MGEKGKGFTGTIIKDIWTITSGGGVETGEGGEEGWGGGERLGGKAENYLNNNKKKKNIFVQLAIQCVCVLS